MHRLPVLALSLFASLAAAQPRGKPLLMPVRCTPRILMDRNEAMPRSPSFNLGAVAFDRATSDWTKHRYAEAALGFMSASAHFATAGEEGNWKYSAKNAAMAFEAAAKIEEGKAAFEAAAAKDAAHAEQLRAAGARLTPRPAGCP